MSNAFAKSVLEASPNEGPWEAYKISPSSRTVYPKSVYSTEGIVLNADNLVGDTENYAYLKGEGAAIVLDFGFNTCGFYAIEFGADSTEGQSVHLSFSESCQFIDKNMADRSMDFLIEDGTLEVPASEGLYVCPFARQRGAFRYMIISTRKPGKVSIKKVYTTMNNQPSLGENLRNYNGYFYSNDDFANTVWYAGAYTVQLSIIPTDTGRRVDIVSPSKDYWANDVNCGPGQEVLVDGARRDRTIWSGDRGISQLTEFITFNGESSINSTDFIWSLQKKDGRLPYACEPILSYGSDTYHLWSIKCVYSTVKLNGGSLQWLKKLWPQIVKAIDHIWEQVDETGTLKIVGTNDWGRDPLKGHSTACNCLLYTALKDCSYLAELLKESELAKEYEQRAEQLKEDINKFLWDKKVGLYLDTDEDTIHSQDANVLAIWYGVATPDKYDSISENLTTRWKPFGAQAPEMQNSVTPFGSSLELFAHTVAGHPERAYKLFRTMWGWMWNAPYSVKSSLIEGYGNDGSCKYPFVGYDPAYISHCHPWASGPTVWMTNQIVGLDFVDKDHKEWKLIPDGVFAEGAFEFAQTGFTSKTAGFISAGWKKVTDNLLQIVIKAPKGTTGEIGVPLSSRGVKEIKLDGVSERLKVGNKSHYMLQHIQEGNHEVLVEYL